MKTFILFLYASFEDHEDLEFFCMEHFAQVSEQGVKYVIESLGNCVIIFDSDKNKETLVDDIKKTLAIEHIKFYFIFEKEKLYWAELPEQISDIIFKPKELEENRWKVTTRNNEKSYDLDTLLDKIQEKGLDSLDNNEKNFLDSYGF